MFKSNKLIEIEKRIDQLEKNQESFIKHANTILHDIMELSKKKYMWELRQEEVELIEDGKKIRKIRKMLN